MDVEILESRVSDNFFYAVEDSGEVALIDPVDGSQAVDWVRDRGLEVRYLVNTHFHRDHTGGNPTVLGKVSGADWVVSAGDADRIASQVDDYRIDRRLGAGDELELGETSFEILETPGHTPGHISLKHDAHLFSGDTVFVGGAGNCSFGGDPGILFETFRDVLAELDDDVTFYPGHDYSVRDIEFILSIEPDNERAEQMLERAEATGDGEIFLTTLGEERSYSPFFRYDDAQLRERLASEYKSVYEECEVASQSEEEAVFRTIRELRNQW